jgi:regulator of sigma E protease
MVAGNDLVTTLIGGETVNLATRRLSMVLLGDFGALLGAIGWYVVPFAVIVSVVVFFHELGHYLVGRWCGVQIDTFSLGFGPELYARVDSHGTRWRLAALPLGGYVKFHGDANVASAPNNEGVRRMPEAERRRTLAGQPVLNRAMIVAAGPIANFILAIVIFTASFAIMGQYTLSARIGSVLAGTPAAEAGIKPGDVILAVNGEKIDRFEDLRRITTMSTGLPLNFDIERGGERLSLEATPRIALTDMGPFGKRRVGRLGIGSSPDPADRRHEYCGLPTCFVWGLRETWGVVATTGAYLQGLVAGRESADQISGTIGVIQVAGEVAKISIVALVSLTALFSVSVGLMNLFPIPMLDGGHLMFYAIEALRGRPLSDKAQEIGLRVGIAIVAALVLFSASNDILHLFASRS